MLYWVVDKGEFYWVVTLHTPMYNRLMLISSLRLDYPVVNGGSDKRSVCLGYRHSLEIFPIQWGVGWSYLEFPNHLVVDKIG